MNLQNFQNSTDAMQLQVNQLPEGVEGKDLPTFLEWLLCTTYGKEAFSPHIC